GWTVTLKAPSYVPFVTYSSQRDLKEKLYKARNSCAVGGKFDIKMLEGTMNQKRIMFCEIIIQYFFVPDVNK
ncbi:MAG: hypothetical protein IKD30_05175, partial [Peptococcaceae bacterium]|nr:hypothetical protein [Peptococcaceae bacterium]